MDLSFLRHVAVLKFKMNFLKKQICNGTLSQFKDLRWFICSTVNKMWIYETCRSWHCVFIYILQCLNFLGVWVKNEPRTKVWSALMTSSLWTEQIMLITWWESSQMLKFYTVVCNPWVCVWLHMACSIIIPASLNIFVMHGYYKRILINKLGFYESSLIIVCSCV